MSTLPDQGILNVLPLNSMPFVGPPPPNCGTDIAVNETDKNSKKSNGPALVFLPTLPPDQEWDKIICSTTGGVGLTGSAAMGRIGPVIGLVDIGENHDSYLFRVSLPGVAREEDKFDFVVNEDGKVRIKGVTTTGESIVCKRSQVFKMTQNMCPPGHFSLGFQLPGLVDHHNLTVSFGTNGILEGIVKKRVST